MPDFRMNKDKPVGKSTQSTMAGFNVSYRKPKTPYKFTETPAAEQQVPSIDTDPEFEITQPLIANTTPPSPAYVLSRAVKLDE